MKVYCVLVVNMGDPTLAHIDSIWTNQMMAADRWATLSLTADEGATIIEKDLEWPDQEQTPG